MTPSLWEKESFYSHSDVIIAGSGFTGLWSAYYLKKKHPRLSITVIDRGIIPTGASTRNAGFACFGSVTELIKDTAMMGEERMQSRSPSTPTSTGKAPTFLHSAATALASSGGSNSEKNSPPWTLKTV